MGMLFLFVVRISSAVQSVVVHLGLVALFSLDQTYFRLCYATLVVSSRRDHFTPNMSDLESKLCAAKFGKNLLFAITGWDTEKRGSLASHMSLDT